MRLVEINVIGAGIFMLTGIAAGMARSSLILVFLLNGVMTLFAAAAHAGSNSGNNRLTRARIMRNVDYEDKMPLSPGGGFDGMCFGKLR